MFSNLNKSLLTFSLMIIILGLIALISASAIIGGQNYDDVYYFVKKQLLIGICLGSIAFYIASKIDYHFWKKYGLVLLIFNIILLLLCFVPSFQPAGTNLSNRWLNLKFITFQPSELLKITYTIFLAGLLSNYTYKKRRKLFSFPFMCFIGSLGIISLIILKQPATGSLIVLGLSSFATYIIAGISCLQFFSIVLSGGLVVTFVVKNTLYRWTRVMISFLTPEKDPLGKGYHIIQSLIGIGSGGLLGIGFGNSIQKFNYLPESHTDAIFSIFAEEFGFLGSFILIMLFLILVLIGFKIAERAPDEFGRFLAIGLICNIGFQAFINIGAMCRLLPMTGIPLPFISYGGSSFIINLISLGLLSNIAKQT